MKLFSWISFNPQLSRSVTLFCPIHYWREPILLWTLLKSQLPHDKRSCRTERRKRKDCVVYILNVITLGTVSLSLHHRLFLYELWRGKNVGLLKKIKRERERERERGKKGSLEKSLYLHWCKFYRFVSSIVFVSFTSLYFAWFIYIKGIYIYMEDDGNGGGRMSGGDCGEMNAECGL